MAREKSNIVPLRPKARAARERAATAEILRFPGDGEGEALRTGGGDVDGPRAEIRRHDLATMVGIVLVVLSTRYWLGWTAQFSVAATVGIALTVGLAMLIAWENLLGKYHYSLYTLLVTFIIAAIYVPFMVAPAMTAGLLIWTRGSMRGHYL